MTEFNGLGLGLGNISRVSKAKSRSISAENFTGEKGKGGMATEGTGAGPGRDLGQGWKISPSIDLQPGTTTTLAEIEGPGVIQSIWMTCFPAHWRNVIIRMYWDGEESPSVEVPFGDFFANGWCERVNVNSLPIAVNPAGGMNSYWEMPFRKSAKITVENRDHVVFPLYYQINYALTDIPEDAAYFHAQWRRSNPLKYKEVHTLVDGIKGVGHYVGTYIAWQVNSNGWWGEGEIKFYLDGDEDFATIVGTGTEDYFGGAWNFEHPKGEYGTFSTPFLGMPQVIKPDGLYRSQQRFGMYRWHIMDPIRFEQDLKVTIQALGWRSEGRYLPLQDDIASTSFWYQLEPHAEFPKLGSKDDLEVI
ncbi:glycoside hydrolase family 172 protein [Lederbergia graminis]|uniref:Glycoside hydrolase family 172 protein n=1 Tax=Lederbergia graminis TaxID=735518 RepID=A0ABW0LL08_9BACI|nr:glycoside hydrolase family 172 protein [Paenibacillus bovis]HLU23119.1 glycoside hydrolase family 172 protein [Bacillaceae bacterium]